MVIVLLLTVGGLFFLLWKSAERREAQLQAELNEARAKADSNNDKFIEALKVQNQVSVLIAQALDPLKKSTDLLPDMSTTVKQTLQETNHIVDMVRNTQPIPRRGDNQR